MSTLLLALSLLAAPGVAPGAAQADAAVKAVTAPSEDHTMVSLDRRGRVGKVLVKEGQTVKAGQAVIQMDDAVERKQLSLLDAKAANITPIRASRLRLERAQTVLTKVRKLHATGAAPDRELAEAGLSAAMAELQLEMDRFDNAQAKGNAETLRLQVERMKLTSPVAGKIERVLVKPGQYIDALAEVARIVQVDPLWIDVPVPLPAARGLKMGRPARVTFDDSPDDTPAMGRIVRIASLADAGSETLEIRVELPNPSRRPAREHVSVTFPAPAEPPPAEPAKTPKGKPTHGQHDQ